MSGRQEALDFIADRLARGGTKGDAVFLLEDRKQLYKKGWAYLARLENEGSTAALSRFWRDVDKEVRRQRREYGYDLKGLGAPPTKGWAKQAPSTLTERRKMPEGCFLDQKNRTYPVCAKSVRGKPRVSCKGSLAAYMRARQQGRSALARKAVAVGKRAGCSWTKEH